MSQRGLELGRFCEDRAVMYLKRNGYKILERNYRSPFGELDVIAKEGSSIVFVEVKSRSSPLFGPPYLRVTQKKKKRIVRCAVSYLNKRGLLDAPCRIDIVSVSIDKDVDKSIELIKDAFGA